MDKLALAAIRQEAQRCQLIAKGLAHALECYSYIDCNYEETSDGWEFDAAILKKEMKKRGKLLEAIANSAEYSVNDPNY